MRLPGVDHFQPEIAEQPEHRSERVDGAENREVGHRSVERCPLGKRLADRLERSGERDVPTLERLLADTIRTAPDARIDYARILDAGTLAEIERVEKPALAALAVFFGTTRLIDNTVLGVEGPLIDAG